MRWALQKMCGGHENKINIFFCIFNRQMRRNHQKPHGIHNLCSEWPKRQHCKKLLAAARGFVRCNNFKHASCVYTLMANNEIY